MLRTIRFLVIVTLLAVTPSWAAAAPYSIKTATNEPPKEVKEPIRKLLDDQSVQLLDDKDQVVGEFWFRKVVPAKVSAAKLKKGVHYRDLEESTLLGAVRFGREVTDYKKQKIKPGVYTIRLGFQPMDGDHMGTAPYPEFGLLIPGAQDTDPGPLDSAKALQELSDKASAGHSHPAVFLLVPNSKPADTPKLTSGSGGSWVLRVKESVESGSQKGVLGIGLTVVGHSTAL